MYIYISVALIRLVDSVCEGRDKYCVHAEGLHNYCPKFNGRNNAFLKLMSRAALSLTYVHTLPSGKKMSLFLQVLHVVCHHF